MSQVDILANPDSEIVTVGELSPEAIYDKCMFLAKNLWWTWHPEVTNLFRDLDPIRWRQVDHNPISLLKEFTPEKLAFQLFYHEVHHRAQVMAMLRQMTLELHRANVCVNSVPFPVVPHGSERLRISLTANHTREQLDEALRCIQAAAYNAGFFGNKAAA